MPDEPQPRFGPAAQLLIRAAQTAMVANVRLRGGIPEVATCSDIQRSRSKLREVARALHEELVGMEESLRRVSGSDEGIAAVAARFPGGWRELEPLVLDACASADAGSDPLLADAPPAEPRALLLTLTSSPRPDLAPAIGPSAYSSGSQSSTPGVCHLTSMQGGPALERNQREPNRDCSRGRSAVLLVTAGGDERGTSRRGPQAPSRHVRRLQESQRWRSQRL